MPGTTILCLPRAGAGATVHRSWPSIRARVLRGGVGLAEPSDVAAAPGGQLSYGEMVSRARTIAARLRAAGIGRGDLVGVGRDRSAHLVPALLATMLAGAANVQLDPPAVGQASRALAC